MTTPSLAPLLQGFFTDRLLTQMEASPNTIASYRDTFRLLLRFASARKGREPTSLALTDIDVELVADFLDHVEKHRHNSARSRNTRLAAIRSFFKYAALSEPGALLQCRRVLAMPSKRHTKATVSFLDDVESAAILAAPPQSTWIGRRDQALMAVALQTGLRASELVNLRCKDVALGTGAHVRCMGKGRKERCTPLRRDVSKRLEQWLKERGGEPEDFVFPTRHGPKLSRDALESLVRKYAIEASKRCATLVGKKISPHVLRHSTAMNLLRHGVDQTVIALWLGHESVDTTQIYLHADLQMKEKALARLNHPEGHSKRFRPGDRLLAFLESL